METTQRQFCLDMMKVSWVGTDGYKRTDCGIILEIEPAGGLVQMYVSEVHDFLNVVKRGGPSPIPLEDGVRSLELARAFRSSGKSGRRVSVRRATATRRAR